MSSRIFSPSFGKKESFEGDAIYEFINKIITVSSGCLLKCIQKSKLMLGTYLKSRQ